MKQKIRSKKSGQVIVEYVLLLVMAIGLGVLFLELVEVDDTIGPSTPTISHPDQSGAVILHWKSLSKQIACDPIIDETCPP